jgi:hypothetical protein
MCFAGGAERKLAPRWPTTRGLDHHAASRPGQPARGAREPSPDRSSNDRKPFLQHFGRNHYACLARRPDDALDEAGRLLLLPARASRTSRSDRKTAPSVLHCRFSSGARQGCGEPFKISGLGLGHVVTGPSNVQKPPQNQRHVRRATCGFYLAVLIGHVTVRSLHVGSGVQIVAMSGSFDAGRIADGF